MPCKQGGAGATLGAARIVGALQPQGPEVHFIVAACENMVAGHGLRPGDVLTSANGGWACKGCGWVWWWCRWQRGGRPWAAPRGRAHRGQRWVGVQG